MGDGAVAGARRTAPSPAHPTRSWPDPMRAVQVTGFGGPEVLDVVDIPDPEAGPGQQLYGVSAAGVYFADTHHRLA